MVVTLSSLNYHILEDKLELYQIRKVCNSKLENIAITIRFFCYHVFVNMKKSCLQ